MCCTRRIDPFTKCHKYVHTGGFAKSEVLYCNQNILKLIKIEKTKVTRYSFPNHEISGELKSCKSLLMYPPLWTNRLAATHDDIRNTSIVLEYVPDL